MQELQFVFIVKQVRNTKKQGLEVLIRSESDKKMIGMPLITNFLLPLITNFVTFFFIYQSFLNTL